MFDIASVLRISLIGETGYDTSNRVGAGEVQSVHAVGKQHELENEFDVNVSILMSPASARPTGPT